MIGMNQIKRRVILGVAIGLAIGIIGIVIAIVITNKTIKTYEEGTNKDYLANYTNLVITLNRDVIQGQTITADMLSSVRAHISTIPGNAILSQGSIVGKIARYNIPKGVTIVSSMVADSNVLQDVRTYQITSVLLPAKLTVGEYVDIRLQVPSGVEYIVLAQKQVLDISGNAMWLDLSETELSLLNSAMVDSYLNEGTKLYAVEYASPETQINISEDTMEEAKTYIEEKIKSEIAKLSNSNEVSVTLNEAGEEVTTNNQMVNSSSISATTLVDMISTYAIEYRYFVDAYNKIETNYQPNSAVRAAMMANKYVVEQAKEALSEESRLAMEASIAAFESSQGDNYTNLISGIDSDISSQQSLRTSVLSNEEY